MTADEPYLLEKSFEDLLVCIFQEVHQERGSDREDEALQATVPLLDIRC